MACRPAAASAVGLHRHAAAPFTPTKLTTAKLRVRRVDHSLSQCHDLISGPRPGSLPVEAHFKSRGVMAEDGLVPIGQLARRTGVATSALRYYERIGLLPPADRIGQRRQYPADCVERVALIRLYQSAGFT